MHALWLGIFLGLNTWAAEIGEDLVLVPEQEPPPGILYERPARRQELQKMPEATEGIEMLKSRIQELWPKIRTIGVEGLSRFQIEATRGYQWPERPQLGESEIIGFDEAQKIIFIQIQGPRLPAKYEIIYRYIFFYCGYHAETKQMGPITMTIRGWVLE